MKLAPHIVRTAGRAVRLARVGVLILAVALLALTPAMPADQGELLQRISQLEADLGEHAKRGELAEAEALALRATALAEQGLGEQHPLTALEYGSAGLLGVQQRHYDDAERHLRRAVELADRQLRGRWFGWWAGHPIKRIAVLHGLVETYLGLERPADAVPWLRLEVAWRVAAGLPANDERKRLVELLNGLGRRDEARALPAADDAGRWGFVAIAHTPVVPGDDDRVPVRSLLVVVPSGAGWTRRDLPMPFGGRLVDFERGLPDGRRLQIHVADHFSDASALQYLAATRGKTDAERLEIHIDTMREAVARSERVLESEWVDGARLVQRRDGAACREWHVVRDDTEAPAGAAHRWIDWQLLCVDPSTHIPVQVDYAQRYPAGGQADEGFATAAAAFFDTLRFARSAP